MSQKNEDEKFCLYYAKEKGFAPVESHVLIALKGNTFNFSVCAKL